MIKTIIASVLLWIGLTLGHAESPSATHFLELDSGGQNSWLVSGLLQNEQAEAYGFLFKIERLHDYYHASAAIYDINNQQILWHQQEYANIAQGVNIEKIGAFFWHYSPINASLIIGYQDEKHQIFNLKLDLIEPTVLYKSLNPTADLRIREFWSGSINGHINIKHEEFVNSTNAWIQNLSQDERLSENHSIHELLCKFQNGKALFALQIPEKNANKAAITSLYNANGEKQLVSQFINLKLPDAQDYQLKLHPEQQALHIHAIFSGKDYNLLHALDPENDNQGYCLYLQNPWLVFQNHQITHTKVLKKPNLLQKTIALGKKPFKIPFLLKNKMTS